MGGVPGGTGDVDLHAVVPGGRHVEGGHDTPGLLDGGRQHAHSVARGDLEANGDRVGHARDGRHRCTLRGVPNRRREATSWSLGNRLTSWCLELVTPVPKRDPQALATPITVVFRLTLGDGRWPFFGMTAGTRPQAEFNPTRPPEIRHEAHLPWRFA